MTEEPAADRHRAKPAGTLGLLASGVYAASVAVSFWGSDFESYLQARATDNCGPCPASMAWQAALATHAAEAGLVVSLLLSIMWCLRRPAGRRHLAWTLTAEIVFVLLVLGTLVVFATSSGLNPAGYIPMCGEGP